MDIWYIKLHRQIKENILFQEKRIFSKFEAWIDILIDCNFTQWEFLLGYEVIKVEAWSFITSKVKMSKKYTWSRWKLEKFLNLLQKQKMIEIKTVGKGNLRATQFFVLNYTNYQDNKLSIELKQNLSDTKEILKQNLSDTQYKKVKKEKKVKNNNTSSKDDDWAWLKNNKKKIDESFEKFWNLYPKKVNKKRTEQKFKNLKLKDIDKLFTGLNSYSQKWKIEETKNQYIPWPDVWINNEKRNDEFIYEWDKVEENNKIKIKKKKENSKQSEKIKLQKKQIWEYRNWLDNQDKQKFKSLAEKNVLKKYNKEPSFILSQYAKPKIKSEIWILIRKKLNI